MSKLWERVSSYDDLEPRELAELVQEERNLEDPRTRQLVFESICALGGWNLKLPSCPVEVDPVFKFPSLKRRIGLVTTAEKILEFLRKISLRLPTETRVVIGGGSALILDHLVQKITEDVDLVDEIPATLRGMREELESAQQAYGLHLAHFQSHYLPDGWEKRLISLPPMRKLHAYRVHSLDVFIGKLFSNRAKDARDLAALKPQFEPQVVLQHLRSNGRKLYADATLRSYLLDNWYVLYGEDLNFGEA